jgi:hypothetical protein
MVTKILPAVSFGFVREIGEASIKSAKGMVYAGLVFVLTLTSSFAFLSFVFDSHAYHEWIEMAFSMRPHASTTPDPDVTYSNAPISLRAADVRKIGHIVDKFETSFLEGLDQRVQEILGMNLGNMRQRALADLTSRLTINRNDTLHVMHELEALRDSNPEGVAVEFADINASLARLKQATDALAVAAVELQTGSDQVTLHDVQKQLHDALEASAANARAKARH